MAEADYIKIVDTFSGYEGPRFHITNWEGAEAELAQRRKDFFARPGMQNARFCQVIVPAYYTWYWDQRQNKSIWGWQDKSIWG